MIPVEPARMARQKTIAESLRGATRTLHKELNRLIVSRLPLALPPQTIDPSIYTSGILHIAPVYIAFETLWREIVNGPTNQAPFTNTDETSSQGSELTRSHLLQDTSCAFPPADVGSSEPDVPERIRALLSNIYICGLQRSDALKRDLRQLTGWSAAEVDAQLRHISSTGALKDFTATIHKSIRERPHVLVAYTYILYMALFAGGRFIRASLESAGDEFWDRKATRLLFPIAAVSQDPASTPAVSPTSAIPPHGERHQGSFLPVNPHTSPRLPLNFFHFNTPRDGEDLKEEYKQHLLNAEPTLTEAETEDIIQEGVVIFEEMHAIVQQLDERFTSPDARDSPLYTNTPLRSERLRNSVAITKERNERKAARSSVDSYEYDSEDLESTPLVEPPSKNKSGRTSEDSATSKKSVRFAEQVTPSEKPRRAFSFDGQDDADTLENWVRAEDSLLRTVLLVLAYAAVLVGFALIAAILITGWWKGRPGSPQAIARAAAKAAAQAAAEAATKTWHVGL
ncbi:hypothetical protein jhhlp_002534 [Lomentospora prolificans]|uniref:Heme oxygenase-like protein n=1 Tax=Lomentospora prolificans TaxID=41688 RepID=A0A2N3NEF1_9PEZI|nr:hypothetical protein jhhlp_002534 [Lomentospora prolificans]